eukprot:COSAG05_NODE_23321_length_259_cov_0.462500_1_plen_28_part_01
MLVAGQVLAHTVSHPHLELFGENMTATH